MGEHRPMVRYEVDVMPEDIADYGGDESNPVEIARSAYEQIKSADMFPVLTVLMPDGTEVEVDLEEVGLG